ncbi:MAG TPA: hypothetical protein GXX17_00050 [Clostridiales bacterium]|nr:hypothetical protein [Clostridiales bacterium]
MRFGLKEKLLAVGVGIILTSGIVATAAINLNNTANVPAVESEESNMETTSIVTQSIDLSPIESAVAEGVEKINSATEDALEKIQSATQEPQKTLSSEPPVSSEIPESKTIPLDVVTNRGDEILRFTAVTFRYDRNAAVFSYEIEPEDKNQELVAAMPIEAGTKCIGKSGIEYKAEGMGGVNDKGEIWFVGIDNFNDLASVTITYAFEGYDPVTVTIDIPLE